MSDIKLSDVLGIEQAAEEALARAGIKTLKELAKADPEAVAKTSELPIDRIREWQKKAKRAGAGPGPSPLAKGWMVGVIGVILAVILGSIMIAIGSNRIEEAKKIQVTSESKLGFAVSFAAEDAIEKLRQARLALHNENWGSAQRVLSTVEDKVTEIERIAPERKQKEISELRKLMGELQSEVSAQSKEAGKKLDSLESAFDKLRQTE